MDRNKIIFSKTLADTQLLHPAYQGSLVSSYRPYATPHPQVSEDTQGCSAHYTTLLNSLN
jgi:hypothetical protein